METPRLRLAWPLAALALCLAAGPHASAQEVAAVDVEKQEAPSIYDDQGHLKLPANYASSLAAFESAFGSEPALLGIDSGRSLTDEEKSLLVKLKEPDRLRKIALARATALKRDLDRFGKAAPEESKSVSARALAEAESEKDPATAYVRFLRASDAIHDALGQSFRATLPQLDAPNPPLPLRDFYACPGEACQLGKALALGVLAAREAPDDKAKTLFKTSPGELLNAFVGLMVIEKPGRAILQEEITLGSDAPPFRKGDEVFLLSYLGEGFTQVYAKGRTTEAGEYKEIEPSQTTFWILGQNVKGECGWIKPGDWLVRSNESAGIALP